MNHKEQYEKAKHDQAENEARLNRLKGQQQALEKQLKEISDEALKEYGTNDIDELREQYKILKQQLDEAQAAYISQVEKNKTLLDEIEQGLKAVS